MTDDVTTGELARRFDSHAKEVKDDIHALDEKVDKLAEVHATLASHGARLDGHDREFKELKAVDSAQRSLAPVWWAAGAAAISAILGIIGLFHR